MSREAHFCTNESPHGYIYVLYLLPVCESSVCLVVVVRGGETEERPVDELGSQRARPVATQRNEQATVMTGTGVEPPTVETTCKHSLLYPSHSSIL